VDADAGARAVRRRSSYRALGGEGGRLPNPHMLIRPFIRREAVLSSGSRGTRATLESCWRGGGAAVDRSPATFAKWPTTFVALEYGVTRLKAHPLSLRLTREASRQADDWRSRAAHATPGVFRTTKKLDRAAGAARSPTRFYVPPPPDALVDCLGAWEKFPARAVRCPSSCRAALMHVQFEAISPVHRRQRTLSAACSSRSFLVEREVLPRHSCT